MIPPDNFISIYDNKKEVQCKERSPIDGGSLLVYQELSHYHHQQKDYCVAKKSRSIIWAGWFSMNNKNYNSTSSVSSSI